MKSFLIGMLGALVILVGASIVVPQYADYTDRSITDDMIKSVSPIQAEVEKLLIAKVPVSINLQKYELSKYIKVIEIKKDGTIFVQGGKAGQLLLLIPSEMGTTVKWKCLGGSYDAMPPECRST